MNRYRIVFLILLLACPTLSQARTGISSGRIVAIELPVTGCDPRSPFAGKVTLDDCIDYYLGTAACLPLCVGDSVAFFWQHQQPSSAGCHSVPCVFGVGIRRRAVEDSLLVRIEKLDKEK